MPFHKARRFIKRALIACAVGGGLFICAAVVFAIHCSTVRGRFRPSAKSVAGNNIPGFARPEDDTFLTYAEWYIVWSYQEKAAWQQSNAPSGFPYFGAIEQYWSGYCCSYGVVRGRYPFNFGDHLMLAVIGTSFTVEYALKGAYENTVGRFSEWTCGHDLTDEDRYAAGVAQNYGLFVADRPFYEFNFFRALRGLWTNTGMWGPHIFRTWERKFWLSLDYGVEGVYCSVIETASHATYGVEEDVTYAEINNAPPDIFAAFPALIKVSSNVPGRYIVKMPRYQKFTTAASALLLHSPAKFVTIAGNGQIMLTAIVPRDWIYPLPVGELLFSSDVLTDGRSKRVALRVPVSNLDIAAAKLPIEHIYDY